MYNTADIQRRRARSISVPETASLSSSLRSIDVLYEKLMHYLQENDLLKKQIYTLSEEHESEVTKLKEINSSLVIENSRLHQAMYNINNSNEKKVDQQQQIKDSRSISEQIENSIQHEKQTALTNEIESLLRKCTEYQSELNNIKKELQDKNTLVQSLSTQVKLKKEENDQLLEACNRMKSSLKNNNQAINHLTTNVKDLVDEYSQFRKDSTVSINDIQGKFKEQFKHVLLKRSQRQESISQSYV